MTATIASWNTVRLDGRTFDGTAQFRTEDQSAYIEYQLWRAGVIEVTSDLRGVTRPKERSADDVLTEILFSGRKSYIVAGLLTEKRKLWDRDEADRNARRFESITDVREKAAMQSLLAEFVASVFSEGK